MKIKYIILGIAIISFICSIAAMIHFNDTKVNFVPCYDKRNNEIIDLVCIEYVQKNEKIMAALAILAMFSFVAAMLSLDIYGFR